MVGRRIGIGTAYKLDGGRNVLELLALVAPHEEHADLDAVTSREFDGAAHLLDADTALHRIEDALAAALGADPDAIAAQLGEAWTASSLCRRSARVMVSNGRCRPRARSSLE